MTDKDRDYVLGTHDEELQRLGLQHRVWRPRVLDAWRRAGITTGQTVIDAGAGPGWATLDLAEIVGPDGRVHALERSERFLRNLAVLAAERRLANIASANLDLVTDDIPVRDADAFWVRWVLAFVSDPELVLRKLAGSLKPGGVAVIHEYLDYETWSLAPNSPEQDEFKKLIVGDWRASGGEPDIARSFPALLPKVGLRIKELRPIVDVVSPDNYVWRWPTSFVHIYLERAVSEGRVTAGWAESVKSAFARAEADPNSVMVTPLVLEVIAERV